jgi:BMFP domain-containing protein YqiC
MSGCTKLEPRSKLMHYCGAPQLPVRHDARRGKIASMLNSKRLDEIVTEMMRALPRTPPDLEKNLRGALTGVLDRLDLVTREELEIQEAVLAKTRARLADMEKRVAELEEKLVKKS